jgi:N-methylhydantoinase A
VLRRLGKDDFLGGAMKLDEAAAHRAIEELAKELGLGTLEAAEGVLTIINSNMANAIRSRTVQKGVDPREFGLVAFGGAGPLHGAEVAQMLSIPEVIVPPYPGITSAMGLLTTDLKYDAIRTQFQVSGKVDINRLNSDLFEMERRLTTQFAADDLDIGKLSFVRDGDLRYVGQGYELKIPFPNGVLKATDLERTWALFHQAHQREYGHHFVANPIEIVNVRVSGIGAMPKIGKIKPAEGGSLTAAQARSGTCMFRVADELKSFDTGFYRRHLLPVEVRFFGPAVVLQKDSTTIVPPGWSAINDKAGNLILSVKGGA